MESRLNKQKYQFMNNNSFVFMNNTPKILRYSKSPITSNLTINKKNIKNNQKLQIKKNPYINFNFNLIQNKNLSNKKIRTITPNLRLREIVNKKIQENNINNLNNYTKLKTELPEIGQNNPNNYQNRSYIHTDYNIKKKDENVDRQLKLIFVMKNKINGLNKEIKEKSNQIVNLKNFSHFNNSDSNNNYNTQKKAEKEKKPLEEKNINIFSYDNKKEIKNISKDKENKKKSTKKANNNKSKNHNRITLINSKISEKEILNKEIQNLNKTINNLKEKYQQEITKSKEYNQKMVLLKNCTFGVNVPSLKNEEKIKSYENKIIELEEQLFQYQQQVIKNDKENIILSKDEYSNIQICLNALLKINDIKEENILNNVDTISFENIEKISTNICELLKITNNISISNFLNDYIIKNKKNIFHVLTFDELFKYDISNTNFDNDNDELYFFKERCFMYDFNNEGKIPIYYLRHIYNEFCFNNKKKKNEQEFFDIVYTCKKNLNYNCSNSNIYDIYYNFLLKNKNESEFDLEEDDYNYDNFNHEILIKKFIDSIMNEELEKCKEREIAKNLSKNNKNKMNGSNSFNI